MSLMLLLQLQSCCRRISSSFNFPLILVLSLVTSWFGGDQHDSLLFSPISCFVLVTTWSDLFTKYNSPPRLHHFCIQQLKHLNGLVMKTDKGVVYATVMANWRVTVTDKANANWHHRKHKYLLKSKQDHHSFNPNAQTTLAMGFHTVIVPAILFHRGVK